MSHFLARIGIFLVFVGLDFSHQSHFLVMQIFAAAVEQKFLFVARARETRCNCVFVSVGVGCVGVWVCGCVGEWVCGGGGS